MKNFIEFINESGSSWFGIKITEGTGKFTELFNEFKTDEMKNWIHQDYHMTISVKGIPESLKNREGETIELTVTSVGWSDKAFGVKVSGPTTKLTTREIPHITIRYPKVSGKGGYYTGNIKTWKNIPNFKVKGVITSAL